MWTVAPRNTGGALFVHRELGDTLRERACDLTDRIGYAHHNIIDERLPAAQHAVRKLLWTTHEARHRLIEGVGHTCRHLREEAARVAEQLDREEELVKLRDHLFW